MTGDLKELLKEGNKHEKQFLESWPYTHIIIRIFIF
jgi:hypothetical protein